MTEEQIAARAERCRRIASNGGNATYNRYGRHHMATIGAAGAKTTIARHGVDFFQGIVCRKSGKCYSSEKKRKEATKDKHSLARDLRAAMIMTGWYEVNQR